MTEYERKIQERERRINVLRLTRALWEYIGGEFSRVENSKVQHLAQQLNYLPSQLIEDIKDTYRLCTDTCCEYLENLENEDL